MLAIREAGVRMLFVGLGSPKQDCWMHAHKDRVQAVMLGVGAAFDFLAGAKPQAPRWMQSSGLEWAFRLATEPRRLWRRYLTQNPRFVILALAQILRIRTT
jgi:N-acetylglucosaminyldiphosphoundecaprenol N-acetyl-beta-D-mannosaminyltransferase